MTEPSVDSAVLQTTLKELDYERLEQVFSDCHDLKLSKKRMRTEVGIQTAFIAYVEGLADAKEINEALLHHFQHMLLHQAPELQQGEERPEVTDMELSYNPFDEETSLEMLVDVVMRGNLLIVLPESKCAYALESRKVPQRQTEESASEVSIKGPRDGFTEDIIINVALVRKRLPSLTLAHERFVIGSRSKTAVSLLYLKDVVNMEWVEESRAKLNGINTEVLANTQQLEEYLTGRAFSLFPLIDYIGRPDHVVLGLERGRLIFLIDGTPLALLAPANLESVLKSPEDAYFPPYYVLFERIIRSVGLFLAVLLPGFWVALSAFNMNQLPFTLLTTITVSRIGLPLPAPLEAILLIGLFEIFREAGVRLPKAVGQTVAVVGGLIIGETAIDAGLTSPTMLVASSISVVSSFLLVNQNLAGTVSLLRLYVLVWSSFLGMFGMFMAFFSIVLYMARLHSFGVPYLAPFSPAGFHDIRQSWSLIAQTKNKKRLKLLKTHGDKS
ncbi:spore germination protein [Paenibacillus koleovorans]|uniref:spore germination protein n=1 Tax=Paenibacillus koleovorans TaxID=121608 RepID=UPI000FDAFC2F|nr:spore germination protein [Paenibacillus koleovorans]